MSRTEWLNRRLQTALREAEDADRVWRRAMHEDGRRVTEPRTGDNQLHVLWQERELARARVGELWAQVASRSPRRPGAVAHAKLRAATATVAFLRWHASRRRPDRDRSGFSLDSGTLP